MLRGIHTAATGMEAMQDNLDTIANNLANVNTTSYKQSRAEFQDLFYQTVRDPGGVATPDTQKPTGIQIGVGVRTGSIHKEFSQGPVKVTNNPLDMAVQGKGFFAVQTADGLAYTRDGSFTRDGQGRVLTKNGHLLVPNITVPPGTVNIQIAPNGVVEAIDQQGTKNEIGQLTLVNFLNPAGLKNIGANLYQQSDAAGDALQGNPGEGGLGVIQAGALEGSNVNVVNEMVNMIQAQRAYEMNSKVMSAADQMLQTTNGVMK